MDMLTNFPCLVYQNNADTIEYYGYIEICGEEYHMQIILPKSGKVKDAEYLCDWNLQQHLRGYENILKQRLKHATSICGFLLELRNLVERQVEAKKRKAPGTSSKSCSLLIKEIDQLGWDRLESIDADFQNLEVGYDDQNGRHHLLKIKLSVQHPRQAPHCIVDLPGKFDVQWKQNSTIESLYNQFQKMVDTNQDFFNMMEDLDKNTWILEPEKPTYSATYRRIAVRTNASLQISVDYKHPHMLPECRFLGSDQVVNPLRQSLNSNLHLWDTEKSILQNLQTLLNVEFPSPVTSKKEEFSVECGICYAYRLEAEIPDEACNDPRCGQPFHQTCLYEWLRSLPSSRQSFNTVFGECPYCNKAITVKMPIKR